ncbi:MAG TPA: hypothetical protein VE944_09355 [Nostoc sp.]|uniref:hypothetical protein n=1 Tax=Nostoc sp. TaxID=1180 RepID=UPI002D238F51|nr:hypothetical protein [Nostoc sp.]HYX14560.1 hypothetical protein [Nostoc sp.]
MSNSYSELIQTALENCQRGSRKPIQLPPGNLDRSFSQKLVTLMESRLPLTDKLLLRWCQDALHQALVAARCGQIVMAKQFFTKARTPLESDTLSIEGGLICKSFHEVAEAYLDYRQSAFDQARTRLFEGLAIDVLLEEKYGYELLYLHRLQIALHLVRIDVGCMCFESAIDLACQLLSYLEGASEALPLPGSWGSKRVALLPPELAATMFVQITDQVALALAGKNHQVTRNLFAVVSHHMQLQANGNCQCHPRSHAWFLIKQAVVSNDIATFLERASHFLTEGRADTPLLWYATVVDLVALCDELALPESELVRQEIAKDAVIWEYLPQPFLTILSGYANSGT